MGVDRGTVSSEKRAATPPTTAVEEAPVTQDIHNAICWGAAGQQMQSAGLQPARRGQLAGRRHALDGVAQGGEVPRPREGGSGWWVDVHAGKHTWVRAAERREAHGRP